VCERDRDRERREKSGKEREMSERDRPKANRFAFSLSLSHSFSLFRLLDTCKTEGVERRWSQYFLYRPRSTGALFDTFFLLYETIDEFTIHLLQVRDSSSLLSSSSFVLSSYLLFSSPSSYLSLFQAAWSQVGVLMRAAEEIHPAWISVLYHR
jgi:hypothetical protein